MPRKPTSSGDEINGVGIPTARNTLVERPSESGADGTTSIRCPHCHAAVSAEQVDDWRTIGCDGCGNTFTLLADHQPSSVAAGTRIGRFELIGSLGKGGFGEVWRARDPQLDRMVAVKVPRRDLTAAEAELFLREGRAAAQIRHPNIVTIHEVGRDGDCMYLVSDLVEGECLASRSERAPISCQYAVSVTQSVAEALAYVHRAGIVHRDLKPANILLDKSGKPYLADFGLARRNQGEITLTMDGHVIGTPAYMSPEQARGDSHHVDGRSDIYSLGVILFRLLAGEPPFRGLPHAVFEQILRDEPPSPRKLNSLVPRDLETICLKCLEKKPENRYQSAEELLADLRLFSENKPIAARPVGKITRARRWSARNPMATGLVAVLVLLAVCAPIAAVWFRAVARSALQAQSQAETSRQATLRSEREKSELLYSFQMDAVQRAMQQSDVRRAGQLLDQQIPTAGRPDLRDFEWHYWQRQRNRGLLWERKIPRPESLAVSSDGQWLAVASVSGFARVEHLPSGETFDLSLADNGVYSVAISPDSKLLACGSGTDQGVIAIFDLTSKREVVVLEAEGKWIPALRFSATGNVLAAATFEGLIETWTGLDPDSHQVIKVTDHSVRSLVFSGDGKQLATMSGPYSGHHGELRVVDLESNDVRAYRDIPGGIGWGIAFTADNQTVLNATSRSFRIARLSADNLQSSTPEFSFDSRSEVGPLAISPDQRTLVAGGSNGELVAWDMASAASILTWPGHSSRIMDIAFLDEHVLLACSSDGIVRAWSLRENPLPLLAPELPSSVYRTLFARDDRILFAGGSVYGSTGYGSAMCAWDVASRKRLWIHKLPDVLLNDMVLVNRENSDHAELVTSSSRGKIIRWNARTGERIAECSIFADDEDCTVVQLTVSGDGRFVAMGEGTVANPPPASLPDKEVAIFDLASGQVCARWKAHARKVTHMVFTAGSDEVLTTGYDKLIRRWKVSTGELLAEWSLGSKNACGLHLMDDGRMLVAVDSDGTIWRWTLAENRPFPPIKQNLGLARATNLSPRGHTLAIPCGAANATDTNQHGQIRLFDTRTWEQKATLPTGPGQPQCVSFSSDGHFMSAGNRFGEVYLW